MDTKVGHHRDPIALVPHRSEEPLFQAGMGGEVGRLENTQPDGRQRLAVTGDDQDNGGPGVVHDGEALQYVPGSDIQVGEVLDHLVHAGTAGGVVLGHGWGAAGLGLLGGHGPGLSMLAGRGAHAAPLGRLDVGCVAHDGQRTKKSSPTAEGTMNSWLTSPPIAPDWASTGVALRPSRSKIRT